MLESWIRFQKGKGENFAVKQGKLLLEEFGDTPLISLESLSKSDKEWQRQVGKLVKLGFHKELGMDEKEYIDSLPKFGPQPENFKGRFDIPVIVDPRIDWKKQSELAGITNIISNSNVRDWPKDSKGYKIPDVPYITWMQDGRKYLGKSVDWVRKNLSEDERGGTIYDGLSLAIFHRNILRHHNIDLPGTQVGSGSAPDLCGGDAGLWLGDDWAGSASGGWGSVSCGR